MVIYKELDDYRKMNLWIDEMPSMGQPNTYVVKEEYVGDKNIKWFNGTICLELRIAPLAISNYAMLNLKFQSDNSSKFKVNYNVNNLDGLLVNSDIAMRNDEIHEGLIYHYYKTLSNHIMQMDTKDIFPSGTLEILGGRYGKIGTSPRSIKKIFDILLRLFSIDVNLFNINIEKVVLECCKSKN